MAISVRTFLAIVTAIVGITAAAVAFAPVYTSAVSSVDSVVSSLRREIGARLQVNVDQFFSRPQLYISSLRMSAKLKAMNMSEKSTITPYLGEVAIASDVKTYCGFEDGTRLTITPPFHQPLDIINVLYSYVNPDGTRSGVGFYEYNLTTQSNTTTLPAPTTPYSYDPRTRPWYPPVLAAQSWSAVYLDSSGNFSVITAGGPFTNDTGLTFGAFAMDFPTTVILNYLRLQTVGKTGRVFLMDRFTNGFLGGNWEVSSVINASGVLRMAEVSDIAQSDALVSRMYAHLGMEFLANCTTPCYANIGGGVNALYVDVLPITDAYGLDMRLVVLLPSRDFREDIDRDYKVSIGAAVGAVVGLLIVAVIAGQIALSPLARLEERFFAVAILEEDAYSNGSFNFLSEVVQIQSAFDHLSAELARIKSFVPQSVLQTIGDDDGNCMAMENDEEGSIAMSESVINSPRDGESPAQATALQGDVLSKSRSSEGPLRKTGTILNILTGLTSRQVTVLVANVIGFHDVSAISPGACLTFHERYLNIICAASSKNRGVVDHFSGDRVFISFNASNNVATHVTRCAATICAIEDCVRKLSASDAIEVRLAAATGRVLAGNMGNNTIKRFSMVGKTVNQSMVLLQLAKMWNVPNVVSSATMETMEFEYNVEAVGIAVLPGSEKGGKRMVVGSVLGAKAAGEAEEWMYELNAGGKLETDLATLKAAYQQLLDQPNSHEDIEVLLSTIELKTLRGVLRLRALMSEVPEEQLPVPMKRFDLLSE
ncbi:membrane-associated protein, putative [Bodo saltans]|uniref:Membrane-associated protein, putative n=1 Tax=Bodo saltans TaxID=75058 RepID=A0A0S4IP83_BODSA|nr:membrane-associated protein, putative [Bodo saltans]|eukprot:CUF03167.1 membrane-associated protein, putative [Bodo saltans]